ncbi:MAG: ABC transporter ATP-binding protein, partial [Anaerolineae bacterium]
MSDEFEFEEEEFTTEFNGRTLLRILGQTRTHWRWVAGFLLAIALVSALDSYGTFLGKRIVDEGIVPRNRAILTQILLLYGGLFLVQAVGVLGFVYLAGVLGER